MLPKGVHQCMVLTTVKAVASQQQEWAGEIRRHTRKRRSGSRNVVSGHGWLRCRACRKLEPPSSLHSNIIL